MKIGIVCTKPSAEKKKDELLNINSTKRAWLKDTPKVHCIWRTEHGRKVCCVAGDVSVGMYIRKTYPDVTVDIIPHQEISYDRLQQNDINFLLIYDLLEAFHNCTPSEYKRIHKALTQSKNVYPDYNYQKFVNDKSKYINYLNKKKVNVIPTFKLSRQDMLKPGIEKVVINKVKKRGWKEFIAKPVFGQESIGFKRFNPDFNKAEVEVKKYLYKMGHDKVKYPGILFQKYIEGFDKNNPEIRLYFVDGKYQYSVITTDTQVKLPKSEHGTLHIRPFKELKAFAKNVIRKLPPIKVRNKTASKLLMRIDIACGKNFAKPWIVNEIEFVPSLYVEDINTIPEPSLGDAIVKISRKIVGRKRQKQNQQKQRQQKALRQRQTKRTDSTKRRSVRSLINPRRKFPRSSSLRRSRSRNRRRRTVSR